MGTIVTTINNNQKVLSKLDGGWSNASGVTAQQLVDQRTVLRKQLNDVLAKSTTIVYTAEWKQKDIDRIQVKIDDINRRIEAIRESSEDVTNLGTGFSTGNVKTGAVSGELTPKPTVDKPKSNKAATYAVVGVVALVIIGGAILILKKK